MLPYIQARQLYEIGRLLVPAKSAQESRLSFKVSGTVKQLPVSVGDILKPGQLIAALDNQAFAVEVQRAKASLAQVDAERRNAESEYQRIRQLYANSNSSRNELDSALSRADSAKANYLATKESLNLAEYDLAYTQLTANGHCSIAEVNIEINENVDAGAQVARVNCGDRWEVNIDVPESLIAAFQSGMEGAITFDAIPNQRFSGSVSAVGISGDSSTTFPVTLTIIERHSAFRSGLAAEVSFVFASTEDTSGVFLVPPAAVGQDEQGPFVYVLESNAQNGNTVTRRRSVTVGGLRESGLEISQGLNDGDRIVTAGITAARDGLKVSIQ